MIVRRRAFLTGLGAAIAAPAIVRAANIMPVRAIARPWGTPLIWSEPSDFERFTEATLKKIAATLGLPWSAITDDFKAIEHSTARLVLVQHFREGHRANSRFVLVSDDALTGLRASA